MKDLSKKMSLFQTGFIYNYAFIMLIAITLLISFIVLWAIFNFVFDTRLLGLFLIIFFFFLNKI